jgi:hypothetical protein
MGARSRLSDRSPTVPDTDRRGCLQPVEEAGLDASRLNIWAVLAVAVALLVGAGAVWSWPLSTADEWSALAGWATAAVALIAGGVAVGQLGEARRLRLEQAQPYVVVFMEASAAGSWYVDLVIRNFGTTATHDVRLEIEPAPHRHAGRSGVVWLPESIPVLVPGQEWRTFWDTGQRMDPSRPKTAHCERADRRLFVLASEIRRRDVARPAILSSRIGRTAHVAESA